MTSPGPESSVAEARPLPDAAMLAAAARPGEPAAAVLSGVTRSYATRRGRERGTLTALDGVSLTIPAGQRLALLGPNGSGKSTLLRILATLDRPDAGAGAGSEVEVLGVRLGEGGARNARARLGVVFQTPGLDELLTIEENLAAQAALYGLSGARAADRIAWAARRLALTDRLRDRVGTLSGGLARRADLARALLHDPDLLLLDEPTTGLDPRAREDFLATVEAVAAEARAPGRARMTVVMSTHLMEEAQRCERVVLLHGGRIIADEAPDALRRRVGGVIIRCQVAGESAGEARGILEGAGIAAAVAETAAAETVVVGRVPEDRAGLEGALVALVRAGIPFEVGPPTLGDVFLSLTGSELAPADGAEGNGRPAPRHRRRRARH